MLAKLPPVQIVVPAEDYEAPAIVDLGHFRDVTAWCFFGKALGSPDYFDHIPITNCSS